MNRWGKHFIFDGYDCNHVNIRAQFMIADFTKALVTAIDMVPYKEPKIVHFGSGDKAGFTLVQLIETSNISCHFIEENNSMCLDVFSCKDFDTNVVIDVVEKYFSPREYETTIIERGPVKAYIEGEEKNGTSPQESPSQGPT